jgi:hypothetical protein
MTGLKYNARSLKIMAKIAPQMPHVRALGVTCSNLHSNDYPPLLNEQKRREDLIKAMDKINSRLGDGSIYPAVIDISKRMQ